MAPKGLRPITETDGDVGCYLGCGKPADQVKSMRTPSGGEYMRGWCDDCLAGSTPREARKAAYVEAAARASVNRSFDVGQEVSFFVRGKVLLFRPKGHGVEILVGRRVLVIDERDLETLTGEYDEEIATLVDAEIAWRESG